jgi:hypothetical protein
MKKGFVADLESETKKFRFSPCIVHRKIQPARVDEP